MVHTLARNWWAILIRGIVAILFGLLALWHPLAAGLALVVLFGAFAFVDGVFAIVAAVTAAERHTRWWPLFVEGLVGIAIGVITYFSPLATGVALYWLIAIWAIVTGIFEIIAAAYLRRSIAGEVWFVLAGVASIVFGILLFAFPIIGAVAVIWLIGVYAIIFGIFWILLSVRLRRHASAGPILPHAPLT